MPLLHSQEAGNAIADVIFGLVNPSGRLPVTFPNVENEQGFTPEQFPGTPNCTQGDKTCEQRAHYSEQLLVGYRWYNHHQLDPAFAFGHGLSFSSYAYSNLQTDAAGMKVTVDITNNGKVAGAEIPQLYLGFPAAAGEPPQLLKGFEKLMLAPGQKATATFELTERDVSVYDVSTHAWRRVSGDFGVFVGASSKDIRLTGKLAIA